MAKPINWVMVRERCIAKTRDWRACATYVKEYLNTAGQWCLATNEPKLFTRDECRSLGKLPHGQYFERSREVSRG